MATRQTSSSGRQKSPRVQVVLSEELCELLSEFAEKEFRTVSNMAKVLIQEGLTNRKLKSESNNQTNQFRDSLETQGQKRLKGIPKRIKWKNN